jgi:broad specificity phosphatase PhoE
LRAVVTWRSEPARTVLLLRHAEAAKNIEDRHGGGDPQLTDSGRRHCQRIGEWLAEGAHLDVGETHVLSQPVHQVRETVQRSGLASSATVLELADLGGISLGLLAGLSRDEAAETFPEAAARLERWRAGTLKLPELSLPGGEPADTFHERVTRCVATQIAEAGPEIRTIVVASSRSTLILLQNAFRLDMTFNFEDYRPFEFSNGSVTAWALQEDSPPVLKYFNFIPGGPAGEPGRGV